MTLLLVSNRLPISLRRIGNRLDVQPNPGGVAAGLAAFYREYKARWFGWPGEVLPLETQQVASRLEKEVDCRPVFLPRKLARAYYAGFADLIGFHTYDYARAFLGSVLRDLGLDNRIGAITAGHRIVQVDVFPLGIDVARFGSASVAPTVERSLSRIHKGRGPSKLLFSVSRLDYTKGIPQQLEAFGRFLEAHPEWRRNVTYLLAVVPSRERVAEYARLKREIDERVGRINSRYGTSAWRASRQPFRQF